MKLRMEKKSIGAVTTVLVLVGSAFLYQNCGNSFQLKEDFAKSMSASSAGALELVQKEQEPIVTGIEIAFEVKGVGVQAGAAYAWSINATSSTCHGHQEVAAPSIYSVHCESPADVTLYAQVTNPNGQSAQISKKISVIASTATPTPVPSGAAAQVFTIKAGTGNSPWNTSATMLEMYVGQTLRFTNADSVNHQLHVDRYNPNADLNGRPCAHSPSPIAPGASYDCVLTKSYDPAVHPPMWDHLVGTNARFYVQVLDGQALYATSCASCHGAIGASTKKKRTASQISNSLTSVDDMRSLSLTPAQVRAIAYALSL